MQGLDLSVSHRFYLSPFGRVRLLSCVGVSDMTQSRVAHYIRQASELMGRAEPSLEAGLTLRAKTQAEPSKYLPVNRATSVM